MPSRSAGRSFVGSGECGEVSKPCSDQTCRRTAARVSEKVGCFLRYQAAVDTRRRARWSRRAASRVTTENSPSRQGVKIGTRSVGQCPIGADEWPSPVCLGQGAPPSSPAPAAPRSAAAGLDRGARPRAGHRCHRRQNLPHAAGRGCDQVGHCPSGLIQAFTCAPVAALAGARPRPGCSCAGPARGGRSGPSRRRRRRRTAARRW